MCLMKPQNIYIVHPKNEEQASALKAFMEALKIKFEESQEEKYKPEFVKKIHKSKEHYKNGDYISIEKKDIKSYLGFE